MDGRENTEALIILLQAALIKKILTRLLPVLQDESR